MLSYTGRAFGCAVCGHKHTVLLKKAHFEDKGGQKCEFLLKKASFEEKDGQMMGISLERAVFKDELRGANGYGEKKSARRSCELRADLGFVSILIRK